jgi:hypothetical protein
MPRCDRTDAWLALARHFESSGRTFNLREAFVQGQFPRRDGITTAHSSFSKVSIQGVTDHRDSIAGRLRIVEELVRTYGRAYEYRAHTTRELQAILENLKTILGNISTILETLGPS